LAPPYYSQRAVFASPLNAFLYTNQFLVLKLIPLQICDIVGQFWWFVHRNISQSRSVNLFATCVSYFSASGKLGVQQNDAVRTRWAAGEPLQQWAFYWGRQLWAFVCACFTKELGRRATTS